MKELLLLLLKKNIKKHSHHKKNGRTTTTRRETTDDDDGVKPAFGSSVRAENARGLSKRRRRFRYALKLSFFCISYVMRKVFFIGVKFSIE